MRTVQLAELKAGLLKLARAARLLREVSRQVLGFPDYEAYVSHLRTAHPHAVPLTRGEFLARALERRHGGGGGRCC